MCTRHDRHDRWPIIEEENWEGLKIPDSHLYTSTCSDSERNSNEQALQGDFFIADADSSTTDEDLICAGDARKCFNPKSYTLHEINAKKKLISLSSFDNERMVSAIIVRIENARHVEIE